jgi:hypothetical protein
VEEQVDYSVAIFGVEQKGIQGGMRGTVPYYATGVMLFSMLNLSCILNGLEKE